MTPRELRFRLFKQENSVFFVKKKEKRREKRRKEEKKGPRNAVLIYSSWYRYRFYGEMRNAMLLTIVVTMTND